MRNLNQSKYTLEEIFESKKANEKAKKGKFLHNSRVLTTTLDASLGFAVARI